LSTHLCGAGLALLGFSASLIIGLWANNPFVTVVLRALCVLVLFYVMGCVLSVIGQKVVEENFEKEIEAFKEENQNPDYSEEIEPTAAINSPVPETSAAPTPT
jgi:hypothetical protein